MIHKLFVTLKNSSEQTCDREFRTHREREVERGGRVRKRSKDERRRDS